MGPFLERITRGAPPEVLAQLAERFAGLTMCKAQGKTFVSINALAMLGAQARGVVMAVEVAEGLQATAHLSENSEGMRVLIEAQAMLGIAVSLVEKGQMHPGALDQLKTAITAFESRPDSPLH